MQRCHDINHLEYLFIPLIPRLSTDKHPQIWHIFNHPARHVPDVSLSRSLLSPETNTRRLTGFRIRLKSREPSTPGGFSPAYEREEEEQSQMKGPVVTGGFVRFPAAASWPSSSSLTLVLARVVYNWGYKITRWTSFFWTWPKATLKVSSPSWNANGLWKTAQHFWTSRHL